MVTPVSPGSYPLPVQPATGVESANVRRSVAEVRRLVNEHQITGAKAMRISSMLTLAEQQAGSGKSVNAERVARQALDFAEDIISNKNGVTPLSAEDSEFANPYNQEDSSTDSNPTPLETELQEEGFAAAGRETTNYTDGSSDQGISFQYSQPLTPAQAPFAVRQHELSHVRRESSDAILSGQRIMTSVTVHSHIDPQTGERHVGGGRAHILVFPNIEPIYPTAGKNLDVEA